MENNYDQKNGYGKRPLWQWVVIYLVVAVVAYGAIYYFVLSKNAGYTPAPSQTYTPPAQQAPQPTPPPQGQSSNPTQPPANAQNIVTYTDSGFSPSTLTIKKGGTVTFKNTASDDMWIASNPHPAHTNYPGFDAKRKIAPGETYQFTFTKTGSWGYHNHLNPSEGGTVIVQ